MAKTDDEFEDNPPDPGATIEALRSLGYSTEAAIADLIDNSVAAGAKHVEVRMHWDGMNTWCSVSDDGTGMNEAGLKQAMKIGAKDAFAERSAKDLGRFGFGLKTASFSQARELNVATRTRPSGQLLTRTWDLDHVRRTGQWQMSRTPAQPVASVIAKHFARRRGTMVVWRHITRVADSIEQSDEQTAREDFVRSIETVEWHLGMTFGRAIDKKALKISLNGQEVGHWDPFLTGNSFTQQLPVETLILKARPVIVQPYVLPHSSHLSGDERNHGAGPGGWNNQQGFYVYRKDRLIAVDWLVAGLTRADNFNLARISLDVPAELDQAWALDIKKTSVMPPRALAADLKRIAEQTRSRSKKVYASRGVVLKPRGGRASIETVWRQTLSDSDLRFQVNRRHPLVESVLRDAESARRSVENLLRVIEQTIPIPYLPSKHSHDIVPLDADGKAHLYMLAEQVYEHLLTKYPSRTLAIQQLRRTEPFDSHPDIITQLVEKQ